MKRKTDDVEELVPGFAQAREASRLMKEAAALLREEAEADSSLCMYTAGRLEEMVGWLEDIWRVKQEDSLN